MIREGVKVFVPVGRRLDVQGYVGPKSREKGFVVEVSVQGLEHGN